METDEIRFVNNPLAEEDFTPPEKFKMDDNLSYDNATYDTVRSYDDITSSYDLRRRIKRKSNSSTCTRSNLITALVVTALVVYATLCTVAITIAFWEITQLKSETASLQKMLSTQFNVSQQALLFHFNNASTDILELESAIEKHALALDSNISTVISMLNLTMLSYMKLSSRTSTVETNLNDVNSVQDSFMQNFDTIQSTLSDAVSQISDIDSGLRNTTST